MSKANPWYVCPAPDLTKQAQNLAQGAFKEVTFAVSYSYNGGTVIDGEWFAGYQVPPPIVPRGCRLVGMGVGLQLNAHPPKATQFLTRDLP